VLLPPSIGSIKPGGMGTKHTWQATAVYTEQTEQEYFEMTKQKRLLNEIKSGSEIRSSYFILKIKHSYL